MEIWMETNEFESKQIKDIEEVMKKMELSLKDDAPLDNEQEKDAVAKEIGDATMASAKTKAEKVLAVVRTSTEMIMPYFNEFKQVFQQLDLELQNTSMTTSTRHILHAIHLNTLNLDNALSELLIYMANNVPQLPAQLQAQPIGEYNQDNQ